MKKIKMIAASAAAAIAVGVLCGCAPLYGRIGQMFDSLRSAREEARAEQGVYEDRWEEAAAGEFGSMMEAVYGDGQKDGNYLLEYEPYGVSYDEVSEVGWFNGKPLAGIYDAGYNTVTSGAYADIGAFIIVDREAGSIARIYEADKETFQRLSGLDGIGSPKQDVEENGFSFYKEDKNIKGLDQAAFTKLENELRMKYKNENALVECNDYVFSFYKEDILPISSFCASSMNRYGARAYIDYHSGDVDLNLFDTEKTDGIVQQVLEEASGSKRDLGKAVKEEIAKIYQIDEKNILIDVTEL